MIAVKTIVANVVAVDAILTIIVEVIVVIVVIRFFFVFFCRWSCKHASLQLESVAKISNLQYI